MKKTSVLAFILRLLRLFFRLSLTVHSVGHKPLDRNDFWIGSSQGSVGLTDTSLDASLLEVIASRSPPILKAEAEVGVW